MKKIAFITFLSVLGMACNVYAESIIIDYTNKSISNELELSNGDIIRINAKVPTGSKVVIRIKPLDFINSSLFTFTSTLAGVYPKRVGDFTDTMYTTTNPEQLSYTYTGPRDNMKAEIDISS